MGAQTTRPDRGRRLRVVHQFSGGEAGSPVADLDIAQSGIRDEAVEAEIYRAISRPTAVALVELWTDAVAHSGYWREKLRDGEADPLVGRITDADSEFAAQSRFDLDKIWVPEGSVGEAPRLIEWASSGPVRVVALETRELTDEVAAELAQDEWATRREPGCLQYEWYRGVEWPEHVLLLELWQDQTHYDRHWQLRLKSGALDGDDPVMPARLHGENSLELYRHVGYRFHYDRWLPTASHQWSETIVWAD